MLSANFKAALKDAERFPGDPQPALSTVGR
jgi:hypothetical protein